MLIVGTAEHLEDLDRQYTLAEDVSVTALAVGGSGSPPPGAGLAVHALLDGSRVARVEEYELAPVAALPGPDGQSMAAAGGRLLVGLGGAHLLVVDPGRGGTEPVAPFDAVEGRRSWENPAGPSPDLRSVAVSPAGSWLVNVHVGGIWRSTDGGGSWTNVVAPEIDVHEVVVGDGGRVAAAAARGLGWSADDGLTWEWSVEGLHAGYARAVALDGDMVYVTASSGPRSTDGRLYRGRLGEPLEPCGGGLPPSFPFNLDTGCLAARAGQVALGTPDGLVYRSSDGGSTFERVTERLAPVRVLRFA
ncbi:MAG: hypothetical protein ACRDY3_00230 [Acidimicrobiales bacterium]